MKFFIIPPCIFFMWITCFADPAGDNTITGLIDTYGKDTLIEVILEERFGLITVDVSGDIIDVYGRPDKHYISEETIAIDLDKSKLNIDQFAVTVRNYVNRTDNRQSRSRMRYQAGNKEDNDKLSLDNTDAKIFIDEEGNEHIIETGIKDEACMSNCKDEYNVCLDQDAEEREKCKTLNKDLYECFKKYTGNACRLSKSDCELKCS